MAVGKLQVETFKCAEPPAFACCNMQQSTAATMHMSASPQEQCRRPLKTLVRTHRFLSINRQQARMYDRYFSQQKSETLDLVEGTLCYPAFLPSAV